VGYRIDNRFKSIEGNGNVIFELNEIDRAVR